ncbi:hypothetical protein MY04_5017 [Flammeovirga sp. MY04]|uniref:hypothetical protein n=1 Tax=Flammeovirga sp. MY04 TaxID=1191459 RepID=UPI0008061585|nr:hypothetical protein [Flammeovirga sp. MY04]ANQ52352.1 hypothetical protein MY04_5017 [Flammeovirga sp. MY04]
MSNQNIRLSGFHSKAILYFLGLLGLYVVIGVINFNLLLESNITWFLLPVLLLLGYHTINRFETAISINIDEDQLIVDYSNNLSRDTEIIRINNNDIENFLLLNNSLYIVQKSTGIKYDIDVPFAFFYRYDISNYKYHLYYRLKSHFNIQPKGEQTKKLRNFKQKVDSFDIHLESLTKGSVFTLDTVDYVIDEVHQLDFENTTSNFYYNLNNGKHLFFFFSIGMELIIIEEEIYNLNHKEKFVIYDHKKYYLFSNNCGTIHNSINKMTKANQSFYINEELKKTIRVLEVNGETTYFSGNIKHSNQLINIYPNLTI